MRPMRYRLWAAMLLWAAGLYAQPAETYVLGDRGTSSWQAGGDGGKPEIVLNSTLGQVELTNTPGVTIDFAGRPGGIGPLRFNEGENIAARVLDFGSIKAPNAGRGHELQRRPGLSGQSRRCFIRGNLRGRRSARIHRSLYPMKD